MTDASPSAIDRIDKALARIEAAAAAHGTRDETLAKRHQVLRDRVSQAVEALDAVIARGGA
ncbi:MAG: hypothetical protein M3R41_05255 [Pseudomonadota bacterium]|nr:hypothetical protein [Pseudomonadota bacterium]